MSRCTPLSFALLTALALAGPTLTACDRSPPSSAAGATAALKKRDVERLLEALAEAPSHGFRPGAFGELGLAERLKADKRTGQAQLRQAVIRYARAMHGEAIPKGQLDPNWNVPRGYDAEADFARAAAEGRLDQWVNSLAPASAQYQQLRQGYATYRKIQAQGGWSILPAEGELRPGTRGLGVAALRRRLAVEDPSAAAAGAGDVYDAALAEAVRRAQLRYGLDPTGVVDGDLRTALDIPVEARLAQIRANLERLRWLPRKPWPDRIEVNTAAGLVDVYRGERNVLHMRAAAGKPGDETPILTSAVETVVLNPTWNVPDGIAQQEILPKGEAYLARMGFVGNEAGGTMLTQKPGPENALGRVKFLFDNRYAVYLHDTPARAAFAREQRSVSHGCVRLERAVDLARLLLSGEPGWSSERVDQVLAGQETTDVKLTRPVPVILVYLTAFGSGEPLSFRQDVYGWDAEVLRRLDAGGSGHA